MKKKRKKRRNKPDFFFYPFIHFIIYLYAIANRVQEDDLQNSVNYVLHSTEPVLALICRRRVGGGGRRRRRRRSNGMCKPRMSFKP